MPLGQNNMHGPGMTNIQSYAITDNPVFKVKIRSLATNVEQTASKGREDSKTDYTQKFKVGDYVKGSSLKNQKTFLGKIIEIEKNDKGDGSALIIIDKESKDKIKLDPSTCIKKEPKKYQHSEEEELPFFADSKKYIYSFSEYLNSKN